MIATEQAAPIPGIEHDDGRTEMANARRLAKAYRRILRYVTTWAKYLVWDGKRFYVDSTNGAVQRLAKEIVDGLWVDIMTLANSGNFETRELEKFISFAKASAKRNGIQATIDLARSEPGMPISHERLDRNPMLFNVSNGIIDLTAGKVRGHDPADLQTKLAPVVFNPAAQCPIWLSVLNRIMGGRQELVGYLQRASGLSLTGNVSEHVLFLCYGTGANGKSLFLNTLAAMMGPDYAMKAPADLLLAKHGESHPTEMASLFGMRMVSCIESDDGRRFAEARVKELTGGDPVTARRMREDFWTFNPTHKLWMAANHKPIVKGNDHGIWRRMRLIPFTVTIPDAEQDKALPEKLRAELPGILNWAIQGCLEWQRGGLQDPDCVLAATAEYRGEQDVIGQFLQDKCQQGEALEATASKLYLTYKGWAEQQGEKPISQRRFGTIMTERGFERFRNNGIWYRGLDTIPGF